MVQTEFGGEGSIRKGGRNWQKILLPIVGLLLIAASGVVAFILSRPVAVWVRQNVSGIPRSENIQGVQIATGFAIFIILILIFAALYAALAPKPPKGVSETELDKEKRDKLLEDQRSKRRKREMKNKMRASRNK